MAFLAISDTHGFARATKKAIEENGGLDGKKLILVGDILDRGEEANELTDYLIDLLEQDKLILIRGNHEDLLEDAIRDVVKGDIWTVAAASHHVINGTFDTMLQLAGMSGNEAVRQPGKLIARVKQSPFYRILLPACRDYYETKNHIFTHGWIPCKTEGYGRMKRYIYNPDWRDASPKEWYDARWLNGMQMARYGITVPDKTVVCGHFHTSYGHSRFEKKCSEFGADADFSPYYAKGIIALDGDVAFTGNVNCVEIEDTDKE